MQGMASAQGPYSLWHGRQQKTVSAVRTFSVGEFGGDAAMLARSSWTTLAFRCASSTPRCACNMQAACPQRSGLSRRSLTGWRSQSHQETGFTLQARATNMLDTPLSLLTTCLEAAMHLL